MASDERFIRMPDVEKKTGLSRATIYRKIHDFGIVTRTS